MILSNCFFWSTNSISFEAPLNSLLALKLSAPFCLDRYTIRLLFRQSARFLQPILNGRQIHVVISLCFRSNVVPQGMCRVPYCSIQNLLKVQLCDVLIQIAQWLYSTNS